MDFDNAVRTPELGLKMCTVVRGEQGDIWLVKKAGKKQEELPLDVFLGRVYDAANRSADGRLQH